MPFNIEGLSIESLLKDASLTSLKNRLTRFSNNHWIRDVYISKLEFSKGEKDYLTNVEFSLVNEIRFLMGKPLGTIGIIGQTQKPGLPTQITKLHLKFKQNDSGKIFHIEISGKIGFLLPHDLIIEYSKIGNGSFVPNNDKFKVNLLPNNKIIIDSQNGISLAYPIRLNNYAKFYKMNSIFHVGMLNLRGNLSKPEIIFSESKLQNINV